jgi:hypothetical protein
VAPRKPKGSFEKLGAGDADGWARSQLEENIPQLARFLFLRQAWRAIVDEDDSTWITNAITRAESRPHGPLSRWMTMATFLRA